MSAQRSIKVPCWSPTPVAEEQEEETCGGTPFHLQKDLGQN